MLDIGLRIELQGRSPIKKDHLFFYPNMRVPTTSPIWHAFQTGEAISGFEDLGNWITSCGSRLPSIRSFTSVFRWRDSIFALVSPE